MRTEAELAAENRVLAYAIYDAEHSAECSEGVLVWGKPIRGEVTLISCYTPAWWYAVCGSCYVQCAGYKTNPDDPVLWQAALDHRCADPTATARQETHQ